MIIMKDVFLYKCLEILKRPEVKSEIKGYMNNAKAIGDLAKTMSNYKTGL